MPEPRPGMCPSLCPCQVRAGSRGSSREGPRGVFQKGGSQSLCVCAYVCMCACMHVHVHMCVHVCALGAEGLWEGLLHREGERAAAGVRGNE